MEGKRPTQVTDEWDADDEGAAPDRRILRYAVPAAIVGAAAATIGLVPAFAGSGTPDLPKLSAEQLVAKVAGADVKHLSGTVKVTTDLGLPSLPGLAAGGHGTGGLGTPGHGGGATADPQARLMQLAFGSHTFRVAADGPQRQRLSVVDGTAEYSLVHNGDEVWAYDSATNSAYHAEAPVGAGGPQSGGGADRSMRAAPGSPAHPGAEGLESLTPQEFAQRALKAAGRTTSVTVDGTAEVAGREAYQLVLTPKQPESTIGSVRIAVDAHNGVPLKFTLAPKSGGKPVVDAAFTSVDFAEPDAKTFDFTPPENAKVTEQHDQAQRARTPDGAPGAPSGPSVHQPGRGVDVPVNSPSAFLGKLSGFSARHGVDDGWASVVRLKAPGGGGIRAGEGNHVLDSLGERVNGRFGSGMVFSTRLVNALITDDGAVYAGAVDKSALIKAANADR